MWHEIEWLQPISTQKVRGVSEGPQPVRPQKSALHNVRTVPVRIVLKQF